VAAFPFTVSVVEPVGFEAFFVLFLLSPPTGLAPLFFGSTFPKCYASKLPWSAIKGRLSPLLRNISLVVLDMKSRWLLICRSPKFAGGPALCFGFSLVCPL